MGQEALTGDRPGCCRSASTGGTSGAARYRDGDAEAGVRRQAFATGRTGKPATRKTRHLANIAGSNRGRARRGPFARNQTGGCRQRVIRITGLSRLERQGHRPAKRRINVTRRAHLRFPRLQPARQQALAPALTRTGRKRIRDGAKRS